MGPVMTYCHTCMEDTYHEIDVDNRVLVCWDCQTEKDFKDIGIGEIIEVEY